MLSFLVDDAYYYLIPAHSFAHGQGWSFDGVTRTSGFQVLYGYLAAAVARVTGLTPALPRAMALLSAVALLAGVHLLLVRGGRLYGATVAAGAVLVLFATPYALWQITHGLEWPWLILATAWLVSALLENPPRAWLIALAAFVAVLTRIDLAIFVAVFTLALAGRDVRLVAWAAAAATAAVGITALNSWLITGQWIPNSVAIKQFWASTTDFVPAVSWPRLMRVTGPGFVLTELRALLGLRSFFVIGASAALAVALCASEWRKGARRGALAVASAIAIAAYTLAYGRGANIMGDHYSGMIVAPVFVLTCALLSAAGAYRVYLATAVGVAAVALSSGTSLSSSSRAPYQVGIAQGAPKLIAHAGPGSRVAAWNAGLAGWQSGKRITNLDGLANADAVPAIRAGNLACYLRDSRITHIMDYGFMFAGQIDTGFSTDEESRRRLHILRNGYDSATLYRCVTLIKSYPVPGLPSQYRLFALDPGCTAALCDTPRR
jgi:hypothetical protein